MIDFQIFHQFMMQLGGPVPVASVLISALAAIIAWRTARKQSRLQLQVAREERRLMLEQIRLQRDSDIIAWSRETIVTLTRMESHLANANRTTQAIGQSFDPQALLAGLSAQIDIGRIYFPNDFVHGKGEDKPRAYRGSRQPILDNLVACYDVFHSAACDMRTQPSEAVSVITKNRREFVSQAQLAINPERYLEFLEMQGLRLEAGEELASKVSKAVA
ncbi:MAG: hypothetical protein AAFO79_09550 [Pseudomonadota bacterium]